MTKELEALKRLKGSREYVQFGINGSFNSEDDYELLRRALTPPTSEEVCKELNKHFKRNDIKYDKHFKSFHYPLDNGTYWDIVCLEDGEILFNDVMTYTPCLIILIGQFYQGVQNGN